MSSLIGDGENDSSNFVVLCFYSCDTPDVMFSFKNIAANALKLSINYFYLAFSGVLMGFLLLCPICFLKILLSSTSPMISS